MTMTTEKALAPDEYRTVIDRLIGLSRSRPNVEPRLHARRVVLLAALELEAVDTAVASLVLMDATKHHAAQPLTRKVFEFAIVAQWIQMNGDASLSAFFDLQDIRETQIGEQAIKAGFTYPADLMPGRPPKTPEVETLKVFENVCDALQGGPGLYFLYRALSAGCHPSGTGIARWLGADDNPTGLRFVQPEDHPDLSQMYTLAASLIWISRAVDLNVMHRPRQSALKDAAKEIGVPSVLKRSP